MKNLRHIVFYIVIFWFVLIVAGCDKKSEKLIEVESKMMILQDEYNSGEYELIYNQASVSFKEVASKDGFVKFMAEKFNQLGKHKSSKVLFSKEVNGQVVNVTYISVYEKYTLAEDVTFKNENNGQGLRLFQYTVDTGGKIVPVTKTESSARVDLSLR